jgi:hypothetical protein
VEISVRVRAGLQKQTIKKIKMKATLEFNLPDDQDEFVLATNGLKFWSVLWELDQSLRSKTKYAPDSLPQDKYDAYQEIRDELRELMIENNVTFDMVR